MMGKKPVEGTAPRRRFTDTAEGSGTVVGAELLIKGEIRGKGNVELRGSLEGSIEIDGLLTIRNGGKVHGEIVATDVVVEGTVEGNIRVGRKVELRSSCKVNGDIHAQTLAIAEGCFFAGRIQMNDKGPAGDPVTFREKRAPES